MDGQFFDKFKQYFVSVAQQEKAVCSEVAALMDTVIGIAETLNRDAEYSFFVTENGNLFTLPPNFVFEPQPSDNVISLHPTHLKLFLDL